MLPSSTKKEKTSKKRRNGCGYSYLLSILSVQSQGFLAAVLRKLSDERKLLGAWALMVFELFFDATPRKMSVGSHLI